MALWEFTNLNKYGNSRTRIVHTKGGLGVSKGFGNVVFAKRFKYTHTHPYMPPTLYTSRDGTTYLMPDWKPVHEKTTLNDIEWVKPKPKNIPKTEVIQHEFKSSSSNKVYITKEYKKADGTITYSCNCFGAVRAKDNKCTHIKSLQK